MLALAGANQPLRVSALHKAWQAKGFDNSSWPSICESVCAGPPWVQSIAEYVASCPTSGDWIQDLSASLKVSKISNTPQLGQEFLAKVAKVQGTSDSMLSAMNLEPPPVFGRVEIKKIESNRRQSNHMVRACSPIRVEVVMPHVPFIKNALLKANLLGPIVQDTGAFRLLHLPHYQKRI
jgi:hypothetical protein